MRTIQVIQKEGLTNLDATYKLQNCFDSIAARRENPVAFRAASALPKHFDRVSLLKFKGTAQRCKILIEQFLNRATENADLEAM